MGNTAAIQWRLMPEMSHTSEQLLSIRGTALNGQGAPLTTGMKEVKACVEGKKGFTLAPSNLAPTPPSRPPSPLDCPLCPHRPRPESFFYAQGRGQRASHSQICYCKSYCRGCVLIALGLLSSQLSDLTISHYHSRCAISC